MNVEGAGRQDHNLKLHGKIHRPMLACDTLRVSA